MHRLRRGEERQQAQQLHWSMENDGIGGGQKIRLLNTSGRCSAGRNAMRRVRSKFPLHGEDGEENA
jgi:hypothetical protein